MTRIPRVHQEGERDTCVWLWPKTWKHQIHMKNLRVGMSGRGSRTEMGQNEFQKKEHDQGIKIRNSFMSYMTIKIITTYST